MGTATDPTSSGFLGGYGATVDPLNLAGRPGGGRYSTGLDAGGSGGKGQVPAAPDYTGAAEAQAAGSLAAINAQTQANRPNMNTPWGSMNWSQDEGGNWTGNMALSPEQQAIFESQQKTQLGRSGLANTLLGNASGALSSPVDFSGLPQVSNGMDARQRAEDAIYGRATSRLDPMWQQREEQARTRLYNQGLREGDQAFDTQVANMGRERTDAYQAALQQAISGGGAEMSRQFGQEMQGRQQSIDELLRGRGQTLNEFQALTGGPQVGMPQMPNFMGASQPQAPNYLGAANMGYAGALNQYGAGQAQQQQLMQGLAMFLPFLL